MGIFYTRDFLKKFIESAPNERIELVNRSVIAYNNVLYDLVIDFIIEKYVNDMDKKFGIKHEIYGRGRIITEVGIRIPRKNGNMFVRFFGPSYRTPIKVKLRNWGGELLYDKDYQEYAEKMKQDYDNLLKDIIGINLRIE
jgi:hypothetical protein